MKIAHIADIHWGLGYPGPTPSARFDDICRIMRFTADKIIESECNMVVVAGDMFRKADIGIDKASKEIRATTAWLRLLTEHGINVLIISGTPSHDPSSAYDILKDYQLPRVRIHTDQATEVYEAEDEDFTFTCFSGTDRSNFATTEDLRGRSASEIHQVMTDQMTESCKEIRKNIKGPLIYVGHFTYDLADTGFEDVLMQNEAVLTSEAVKGYELVLLGHIHRPQQNDNVFYPGSPERLSFNDEKIMPGFWIHEWDTADAKFVSEFIQTPARKYQTITWDQSAVEQFILDGAIEAPVSGGGEIVRLRYRCSEALNRQLNRRQLEKAFYGAGAYFVAEIKAEVDREERQRDEELTDEIGPVEAVRRWADANEIEENDAAELAAMTEELIADEN